MTLYVLTGPTAVGKTELGLKWAESHDAEILYCDSTVVYQGMDIGTAKPSKEEQARVLHHGLDLVPVSHTLTIKDYLELAQRVVKDVKARGKQLLITGGSGFYLKVFFSPVIDDVEVPEAVRLQVQQVWDAGGLEGWVSLLKEKSPIGFGQLDVHNPRRVVKALERVLATGKELPELEAEWARMRSPFADHPKQVCLLDRSTESLKTRIALRAKSMLASGLIEEVERLIGEGLLENPVARNTIGYRETISYLKGEIETHDTLEATIIQNTIGLLKKQRTFFRHQIPAGKVLNLDEMPLEGQIGGDELFPIAHT